MSEVKLSASRIKTAKTCSWLYWVKYHLMLPDKKNDGSSRGDICHNVFEFLGKNNKKRLSYHSEIIKQQDAFSVPSIKRYILSQAANKNVDDQENLTLINDMIVSGLEYDFYGKDFGKPTKCYSEYEFDISVDEKNKKYRIKGFIDKLFLYKSKKVALIRDFKTSKNVFKGKEVSENLQDYMYCLAVRHLFPEYTNRKSEFVFLKFDLKSGDESKGLLKMDKITAADLNKFEKNLTDVQLYLSKFNQRMAKSNYAADQKVTKEDGFAGQIVCGFARYRGQPKKNGDPMWHCAYKFPFDYYALYDENEDLVKTAFMEDYYELIKMKKSGWIIRKENYQGCPRFNSTEY